MSNRGLGISLNLTPSTRPVFVATLLCPHPGSLNGYLAIYIERLPTGERQYARIKCDQLGFLQVPGRLEQIFVRPSFPQLDVWSTVMLLHLFHLKIIRSGAGFGYQIANTLSIPFDRKELEAHHLNLPQPSIDYGSTFKVVKDSGRISVALLLRRNTDEARFALLLGSRTNFEVGFDLVQCDVLTDMEGYERDFEPRPFGQTLSLQYHHVTAKAATKIQSGVKVYLVDILIQGIPLPPPTKDTVHFASGKANEMSKIWKLRQSILG